MKRLISYLMLFVISYSTLSIVVNYVIAEKVFDLKVIQENYSNRKNRTGKSFIATGDHKESISSVFAERIPEKKNDFSKKGISFKKNKIKKCITPDINFFDIQLFASSEFSHFPSTISSAYLENDLPPPRRS